MKMRYVDFLSDEEYSALESRTADQRMFRAGMFCLMTMLAACGLFMIL